MLDMIFDTETVGLVKRKFAPTAACQPDAVQLAAVLADGEEIISKFSVIVRPTVPIDPKAAEIHGITQEKCDKYGVSRRQALSMFHALAQRADRFVCHNFSFDSIVMQAMYHREGVSIPDMANHFCTMLASTDICRIPSNWKGDGFKWPKLEEAYRILVDPEGFEGAHDALVDVTACHRLLCELRGRGVPGC